MMNTAEGEVCGSAALYALGALEGEEARAFEAHLSEGCDACASELRGFESVVGSLGLAAQEAEPPASARASLLERLAARSDSDSGDAETSAAEESASAGAPEDSRSLCGEGFLVVRAGEGQWLPTGDAGVSFKLLYTDRERGTFTTLVRMEAGAHIPAHRHLGVEQCLVIEGDLRAGGVEMYAGDFNCSLPGSVHEEIATNAGALFLIVGPERYEVVSPRGEAHA